MVHGNWCSEIRRKKVRWPYWIAANLSIRKIHSTVEKMDACEYSIKIITVPTAKRITQTWMIASSPFKINIAPFKEWMNVILLVIKTDTLLQRSDVCN